MRNGALGQLRQLGDIRRDPSRLIPGETTSLYSADVQLREPQRIGDWGSCIGLRYQEFVK
jgi:hypothetical protein